MYWAMLAAIGSGWSIFAIAVLSGANLWLVLALIAAHLLGLWRLTKDCKK